MTSIIRIHAFIFALAVVSISCVREMDDTLEPAPCVPSQLAASSLSDSSVRFSWAASEGAQYYSWVLRDRYFEVVDLGKTSLTSVEVSGLNKGDKYTFAVRAAKNLSVSEYSGYVTGIPGGTYIPVRPEMPSGVRCSQQGKTSLTFVWESVPDAKEYEFILQDDGRNVIQKDSTAETAVDFEGLTEGKAYFIQVKSLNDGEQSEYTPKTIGIPGGEYKSDSLKILYLTAPDGFVWKVGDKVMASAGGITAEYECESDNATEGLFWPVEGTAVPAFGNADVVYPSGFNELPAVVTEDFTIPMAVTTDGIWGTMSPLCARFALNITSDVERTAQAMELIADKALSGSCTIDWTSGSPRLIVSGDDCVKLDCSASPKGIGAYVTGFSFPVPFDVFNRVSVEATLLEGSCKTIVEGGMDTRETSTASCIFPDENDFYSIWHSGNNIVICNDTLSKSNYPEASLLMADDISTAFNKTGLYFADNSSENRIWTFSSSRTKAMAGGTVLVGRYKNYPQPVMKQAYETDKQGCFIFNGGVKILNYRIEAKDNGYGIFQGRSGVSNSGNDTFRFQDCTLVNENNFLTSFNNGSYAVPKAMYFDNCIIRVKGTVVKGGNNTSNKPEKLETLSFNNTVFAPYSASETVSATSSNGCLFDFASTVNATTALNIDMSWCTVYEYQPQTKVRGLIEVKDYADFSMDHTAFYHSSYSEFDNVYYTIYSAVKSTVSTGGISISSTYVNKVDGQTVRHSGGSKGTLAPSPRTWSVSVSTADQTVDAGNVDAARDYFPVSSINAGASYQDKYWTNIIPNL